MPLSPVELAYQAIQTASEPSTNMVSTTGTTLSPITVLSKDLLNEVWPTDEAIREIMSLEERPWGEFHHRSSTIDLEAIKTEIPSFDQPEIVPSSYTTVHTIDSEGNMGNISKTLLIDISIKTGIMENIQYFFSNITPFQLAFGMEVVLLIECEIPSLKLAVELLPGTTATEECLLSLNHLDETRRDTTLALEAH